MPAVKKILTANAAAEDKAKFMQQNILARSELLLLISPLELKLIKSCKTSKEIWKKIERACQSRGPARKATLLKQLILKKTSENSGDVCDH